MLANWGAGADAGPRVAATPAYQPGTTYRSGIPAHPISIEMPSSPARGGQYSVSDDDESAPGVQTSISDGPSLRLPPLN
jgi:hypothetical protein